MVDFAQCRKILVIICNVLTPSVFVGFGAKLTPEAPVMHEFFVTLDPNNPFCAGVPGLLDAYRR